MTIFRLNFAILLVLGAALPAHVIAATYTVRNTDDPDAGDATNCTAQSALCSFRDAIAAADQAPDFDTILFEVDDTIHIKKQLTAIHPVAIEGGKGTAVRIHQGYVVTIMEDRFGPEPRPNVKVLQPTYFSLNGTPRAMLELRASGSSVSNMILDGSITPAHKDKNVIRIDWNSDGEIGNLLTTVTGEDKRDRWLVAGGILLIFPEASPGLFNNVTNNELRYMSANAITVENSAFTTIDGNIISVGLFEGIKFRQSGLITVTNNRVVESRTGFFLQLVSGLTVRGNDLIGNWDAGISVERVNADAGPNVIENNYVVDNGSTGIRVAAVGYLTIDNNEVKSNGQFGIDVKSLDIDPDSPRIPSGAIAVTNNDVKSNGTDPGREGGIRIAEGSHHNAANGNQLQGNSGFGIVVDDAYFNAVQSNFVTGSGGGGIVLFNGAQWNFLDSNTSEKNQYGILSVSFEGDPGTLPSDNTIVGNTMSKNSEADAADESPTCVNTWLGNTFKTAISGAPGCVQ